MCLDGIEIFDNNVSEDRSTRAMRLKQTSMKTEHLELPLRIQVPKNAVNCDFTEIATCSVICTRHCNEKMSLEVYDKWRVSDYRSV